MSDQLSHLKGTRGEESDPRHQRASHGSTNNTRMGRERYSKRHIAYGTLISIYLISTSLTVRSVIRSGGLNASYQPYGWSELHRRRASGPRPSWFWSATARGHRKGGHPRCFSSLPRRGHLGTTQNTAHSGRYRPIRKAVSRSRTWPGRCQQLRGQLSVSSLRSSSGVAPK